MGDRTGFVWQEPPTWGKIDELVAAKWKRMKIEPSELCTDLEFIRRVYLDLTGLPPSPEEMRTFLDDKRETQVKRDALIDRLIGSPEYVDFWANKWADLLQCNSKFLGSEGAELFRAWIRKEVEKNTPYDQFAREILTATGSNRENPAASYWKICARPRKRWRTPRIFSLPRASIATNATTIRSSAGRRTSIIIWPPILPRSRSRKIRRAKAKRSAAPMWKAPSRCLKSCRCQRRRSQT